MPLPVSLPTFPHPDLQWQPYIFFPLCLHQVLAFPSFSISNISTELLLHKETMKHEKKQVLWRKVEIISSSNAHFSRQVLVQYSENHETSGNSFHCNYEYMAKLFQVHTFQLTHTSFWMQQVIEAHLKLFYPKWT